MENIVAMCQNATTCKHNGRDSDRGDFISYYLHFIGGAKHLWVIMYLSEAVKLPCYMRLRSTE